MVSNRLVGLSGSIGCLELCRRYVAEVAVEPPVVVPVGPSQGGQLDVFGAVPGALSGLVDEFGLVEADDGLG